MTNEIKEINPYQQLGKDFDPFGIAIKFNLPFPLAEAFKKLACAGIDGRIKSKEQDVKEAIYSIKRAIEYHQDDRFIISSDSTLMDIDIIKEKYNSVLSNKIDERLLSHAIYILWFAIDDDVQWLDDIIFDLELGLFASGDKNG